MSSTFTAATQSQPMPASPTKGKKSKKFKSRAVVRLIEPGSMIDCSHCGSRVKFQARLRLSQVICNVYIDNAWDRVEHFHADCYEEASRPYGDPAQ